MDLAGATATLNLSSHAVRGGNERSYQLLIDAVVDYAIYMLDPDGRVTSWNAGAQRLKGYADEEIVGAHFSRFYTEEERRAGVPMQALDRVVREGRFEQEGWRVRKGGDRFLAHVIISPVRDLTGDLIGFVKVTRDITNQREKLLQAHKMEAVGQLTGGIAHDFNNLLSILQINLDRLRQLVDYRGDASRLVENSILVTQRGVSLTGRLLAFAGRREHKVEPVHLSEVVGDISLMLRQSAGTSIRIEMHLESGVRAHADVAPLELALLNLVVNARDAMPGGGTITISDREEVVEGDAGRLRPGRYVCLSVSDTGPGMDEATLARVFEPFFTTKADRKGTGLGLPMIRDFAEQSGGQLVLRSRPGEGTTAEIWLPGIPAEQVAPEATERNLSADADAAPLTVLVVEDDPLILMNTTAMLEDLGHEVVEASSGEQALQALRRSGADLVITDEAMAGMSGTQLREVIRAQWPGMPVILATGYADGYLAPDVQRLVKPFLQRELADAISAALGQMHAGRQADSGISEHAR